MTIKFKKTFMGAIAPKQGNDYAAGIDLFIPPGIGYGCVVGSQYELPRHDMICIDTGIAFEIPEGYVGLIRPRGSALAKGLIINGTIDQDFRGSIRLFITNAGPKEVLIESGKAYAQMILIKQDATMGADLEEVSELSVTKRGEGMLGSTGNS